MICSAFHIKSFSFLKEYVLKTTLLCLFLKFRQYILRSFAHWNSHVISEASRVDTDRPIQLILKRVTFIKKWLNACIFAKGAEKSGRRPWGTMSYLDSICKNYGYSFTTNSWLNRQSKTFLILQSSLLYSGFLRIPQNYLFNIIVKTFR